MLVKRILYAGPDSAWFHQLVADVAAPAEIRLEAGSLAFDTDRATLQWIPAYGDEAALAVLDRTYVNLLVVDMRVGTDHAAFEHRLLCARSLLEALDDVDDLETRYGFHRILFLVSGPDAERVDQLLVELGGYGIRHVLHQRQDDRAFGGRVRARVVELMFDRQPAKTALCAAGGGITAIFFEIGALKCLDDALSEGAINDFDMYFGISAGAVVTAVLANGFSIDELMASIAGVEGGRIPFLDLSLVRLGHLNAPDIRRRLGYAARRSARAGWDVLRGKGVPSVDAIFLEATALVGAPFRSDGYERVLRPILEQPGATNDFRQLHRELYIGASNQDARRHTLFGDAGTEHVPVSKAVQASLSINPAFSAVEIDGEWYEDGAVTRTSNFTEAIGRGASLIFVLDPFVPYVSKDPGWASRRGMLFNIDQDVRSLSYTRYENARNWALRRHPEVSSFTFLPNNRLRRLLSINPMDHRVYMEVFRAAYLGTLAHLERLRHRLTGDLAVHGIHLDTRRADVIAQQLRAATDPTLADFYVDRRVAIPRPALNPPRSGSPVLQKSA